MSTATVLEGQATPTSLASGSASSEIRLSPALFLAWTCAFLPLESAPIWIPAAVTHYGASDVAVGGIATMQVLFSALSAVLIAPRIARRSPRAAMLAGLLLVLVAAGISVLSPPTLTLFAAMRALDGVGSGLGIAAGAMLAGRTALPQRTFSWLQLGQVLGSMATFGISAQLISRLGVGGGYAITLCCGVAALVALLSLGRAWSPAASLPESPIDTSPAKVGSVWTADVVLACLGITLVFCAFVGMVTSTGAFGESLGLSLRDVGLALAISTPFGALASILAGFLSGRVRPLWILVVGSGGAAFGAIGMGFASHNLLSLSTWLCMMVLFLYTAIPSVFAGVSRSVARGAAATAQGAQMLGLAMGPLVGALMRGQSLHVLSFAAACALAGGLLLSSRIIRKVL